MRRRFQSEFAADAWRRRTPREERLEQAGRTSRIRRLSLLGLPKAERNRSARPLSRAEFLGRRRLERGKEAQVGLEIERRAIAASPQRLDVLGSRSNVALEVEQLRIV
jgi:hypothetical protein